MTTSIRIRGEVPFPQAGEGVYLRFSNPDCDQLQGKFGENWFADAVPRLNRVDTLYLRNCLAFGGKKDGKPFRIDYDTLDCPIGDMLDAVLDALFLAVHGRKFDDHLDYLANVKKLEVADGDQGNG
ncbi:MAG: hypothetical protein EOS58_30780 [Mesorhizobium sp.]|nr:MAG: hypothetical protein EOS58_30780 [Mesorhizobium sp.]